MATKITPAYLRERAADEDAPIPITAADALVVADALESVHPLVVAIIEYHEAILSCANDPAKMSSFCSAQGDDLDAIYAKMLDLAVALQARFTAAPARTALNPGPAWPFPQVN